MLRLTKLLRANPATLKAPNIAFANLQLPVQISMVLLRMERRACVVHRYASQLQASTVQHLLIYVMDHLALLPMVLLPMLRLVNVATKLVPQLLG